MERVTPRLAPRLTHADGMTSEPDLESVRVLFDGGRLTQARELAGLSKADVAKQIDISAAAIGQFEAGTSRPSDATLTRLAEELRVEPAFFAATRRRLTVAETDVHFRSLRSTSSRDRARARAQVSILAELVTRLGRDVALPRAQLPSLDSRLPPAEAARAVRQAWGLDNGPIRNVVELLESKGIVIARLPAATAELDAFSCWIDTVPYIVLVANKQAADRSRFDAAHELAHLVLDEGKPPGDLALERKAHGFAAEFLAPAEAIRPLLPTRVDWSRLAALKLEWGVSMAMLVRRMRDLGLIADVTYQRAMIDLSRRGWRTHEPVDIGSPESPELVVRAARTLQEQHGVSLGGIASELALPTGVIEHLLAPTRAAARTALSPS